MSNTVTQEYILDLLERRKTQWAAFQREVRADIDARHNRDFSINDVPQNYRSSTEIPMIQRVPDLAQRVVAIITDDDPAISVRPTAETDKAKRNASLREKCLSASIEAMNKAAGRDVWRMAADAAVTKRLGIIKVTLNRHAWDGEPDRTEYDSPDDYLNAIADYRKGAPFPIAWQDIDPETYFPDRVGGRPNEVLEVARRPVLPTLQALHVKAIELTGGKRQYRKLRLGDKFPVDGGIGRGTGEEVEVVEYWNNKVVCYVIDGQKVDEIEHDYGRPPYFAFGSYTTPSRLPEEAYNSIVGMVRGPVKSLKRWLAIKSNWGYLAGWPFFKRDKDSDVEAENFTQIEAGAILDGIDFMPAPKTGDDLNQMLIIWQTEADRAGLASVMYGQGAGTSSGYQVASLQAAAQSVLKPAIRNASQALSEVLAFEQELIDKHLFRSQNGKRVSGKASKVYVWGTTDADGSTSQYLGFGPDDINGYYPVTVTLRPLMPLDEIAQRDSALRMLQGGLWDPETALERTGENQPEEILDRQAAYEYMKQSGLNMRLAEDAARKRGLLPSDQQAQAPVPIYGPRGGVLTNVPQGTQAVGAPISNIGGPGMGEIGPMEPSVPGQTMPLRPTAPPEQVNLPPIVMRRPGGPQLQGPMR